MRKLKNILNVNDTNFFPRSWLASLNNDRPSLIFPSGSRLRRSVSSVSNSNFVNTTRPKSLIDTCEPKRHSDNYNPGCTVKKKNLHTIEETSSAAENDCYILQIGCYNWVGRWEHFYLLFCLLTYFICSYNNVSSHFLLE